MNSSFFEISKHFSAQLISWLSWTHNHQLTRKLFNKTGTTLGAEVESNLKPIVFTVYIQFPTQFTYPSTAALDISLNPQL